MAGIRVKGPLGAAWEYQIEGDDAWQKEPVFNAQPGGGAFVPGESYTVNCRNTLTGQLVSGEISFSDPDNGLTKNITLDLVIANNSVTDNVPEFRAGLIGILPEEPADAKNPAVVIAEDGTFYRQYVPPKPVLNIIIFGHYIERDPDKIRALAPRSEWQGNLGATPISGFFRIVGDATIGREKKTYHVDQKYSDGSWVGYNGNEGAAVFGLNTAIPGLSMNAATGELDATAYAENYDINCAPKVTINGTTVATTVKVLSSVLTIVQGNYSFLKNNPPTTAPQLYFNVLLSRAADLEVSMEVTDYSGTKAPNYAGFVAMEQNKTEALRRNGGLYNAPINGYVELTIREAGKTTILLKITLPKLPNGNVPSTQFFPVTT